MTSLAQKWAEARKQRQAELQAMFEASRAQRLQEHAEFLANAAQDQVERAAEASCRSITVETFLQQTEEHRLAQAATAAAERRAFIESLAFTASDLLAQFTANRAEVAEQLAAQLAQFHAALSTETAELLSRFSSTRSEMAEQLSQQLAQFHQLLQQDVIAFRLQVEQQRLGDFAQFIVALQERVSELKQETQAFLVMSAQERQERAQQIQQMLNECQQMLVLYRERRVAAFQLFREEMGIFRTALHESIWGEATSPTVGASNGHPTNGHSNGGSSARFASSETSGFEELSMAELSRSSLPITITSNLSRTEDLQQTPVATSQIREFVHNFISRLESEVSLLQVVGNRELVRDLLAQGSKELRVDPFEILIVLRQMVNPEEVTISSP
ncbi:hypothetical protein [Leptolyngbya sp. FACHB-261]|uniref:hypothetical protein n=1 Tax=Leptolyngbya sp. FACHB-261 TaxID=2692806 RepID=UPI0016899755|nr:hypothetical protein [Leptolyngbya sp. FACHB-261]MBD2103909.1 hypothetical protein [Leptolyngbya sp. FACHB-261]